MATKTCKLLLVHSGVKHMPGCFGAIDIEIVSSSNFDVRDTLL